MEGCAVAIRGGLAAEVELTALVTVRGVQAWPTAAEDQPPPQSQAHTAQAHSADSVCVCTCVYVYVNVSLRPAREKHCEVLAFILQLALSPFSASLPLHPSISFPFIFYKVWPSLPASPSSRHSFNLSVHSPIYPANQSVRLYPGIITTTPLSPSPLLSSPLLLPFL